MGGRGRVGWEREGSIGVVRRNVKLVKVVREWYGNANLRNPKF